MKYYFKGMLMLVTVLTILAFFTSCTENKYDSQKLKYYTINNEYSDCADLIKKYNNYCVQNLDKSYQIEIVEFDSKENMYTKMSTEIMAGGGPDIFSLDQSLPFEKLIDNGTFADVDELVNQYNSNIDFSDYNSAIMNCGVTEGKRYIVPISYCPNILIATEEQLAELNIKNDNFSFETFANKLQEKGSAYQLFENESLVEKFFYSYLNQYVDNLNKSSYFSTYEFSDSLDKIGKMIANDNSPSEDRIYTWKFDEMLFETSQLTYMGTMEDMLNSYYYVDKNKHTLCIVPNYDKNSNISAFVQFGIAINKNSLNKEKALKFIEYLLSDEIQKLLTENYSSYNDYSIVPNGLPVNNTAFEYLKNKIQEDYIDINDDGKYDNYEIEYSDNIISKFINDYISVVNQINNCSLYNYKNIEKTYYNSRVIGKIVNNYLNKKISKEKFIRQLTSATEIYLKE